MTKQEFLKKLNKYLNCLSKENKKLELQAYETLDTSLLDPKKEAEKIIQKYQINIKFIESASIIFNRLKKKESRKNTILFLIKTFFIIILIKIPFIYVRDMIVTLFNNLFVIDRNYFIWSLIIEFIYAFLSIYLLIKYFKKEATKNME